MKNKTEIINKLLEVIRRTSKGLLLRDVFLIDSINEKLNRSKK